MDVGDVSLAPSGVTSEHETISSSDSTTRGGRRLGYRAGIVGTGFMGRVHAQAVRATGGDVVGVVGSGSPSGRAAAAALRPSVQFDDFDALVSSPEIDVVHICTPNHLHHGMASAALNAGKHVVCEKPLATSSIDAQSLVDLADAGGRVGVVPFVYRFHPLVREARERVRTGQLGTITLAHGSYLQDWLLAPSDDNWRVDPDLGGATRAFGDIGVHWCDLLEFVTTDTIIALSARLATTVAHRGSGAVATEDIATISFETAGGVVGTSVVSQVSPGRKNRLLLEVSGTSGSICFDQEQPEQLWLGARDANSIVLRDPATASPAAARMSRLPAGHAQGYQDCFDSLIADTASAIRGETVDGLPTFAAGLRAAHLAEAVLRSATDRTWVEVTR